MKTATLLLLSAVLANASFAQISVGNLNPEIINFNSFDGSGFSTTPTVGQLDSNTWRLTGVESDGIFGGTHTTDDFARGIDVGGGVSTGGLYAFDINSNIALGFQPGDSDLTPGTLTLRLVNNTGSTLDGFNLSYDVFVNNDQGRANSLNFAYSLDDTSYTGVPIADITSTQTSDSNGFTNTASPSFTISSISLANGEYFYFQWQLDDVSGAESRDEFALDNISFNAVVPEPGTYALLSGCCALGFVMLRRRN